MKNYDLWRTEYEDKTGKIVVALAKVRKSIRKKFDIVLDKLKTVFFHHQ